jgi:hypothetical protein
MVNFVVRNGQEYLTMGKKQTKTGNTGQLVAELVDEVNAEVEMRDFGPVPGWVHHATHSLERLTAQIEADVGVRTPKRFLKFRLMETGEQIRKEMSAQFTRNRVGYRTRRIVYDVLDDWQPRLLNAYMDFSLLMSESVWELRERALATVVKWKRLSGLAFAAGVCLGWLI